MGGQETFIMNIYRNINRNDIQFDFVVHSQDKGYYDDEIEKLGGKIYRITPMSKNLIRHMLDLKNVIVKNEYGYKYDTVHRHTCITAVVIDLIVAKYCKVKNRIAHCHSDNISSNYFVNFIFKPFINKFANIKMACSYEAAKWLFGKKANDALIVNNGINIESYLFSLDKRKKVRNELNIDENVTVFGHIGSFSEAKNHEFIIDIFDEYNKKNNDSILLLCGGGKLKKYIECKIKQLKLENNVKCLGIRSDINNLCSAFDCFLFPSLYEGLGIALIEAQVSGLKCIISESIPEKAIITDNVKKLKLTNKEVWLDAMNSVNGKYDRYIDIDDKKIRQFDIKRTVEMLSKIYE